MLRKLVEEKPPHSIKLATEAKNFVASIDATKSNNPPQIMCGICMEDESLKEMHLFFRNPNDPSGKNNRKIWCDEGAFSVQNLSFKNLKN
jgi:hypothetical protein